MVKYLFSTIVILTYLGLMTNCVALQDINTLNSNIFETKKIEAVLTNIEDMNMKIIDFEIDGSLYSLTIIDRASDYKIFDLRIKNASNVLLDNDVDLFCIRSEFMSGDIIHTEILYNKDGFEVIYIISEDSFHYGNINDGIEGNGLAAFGNELVPMPLKFGMTQE